MRIGILGGTFDPPHNGHLAIADAARRALDLARVVFIPANQPPHKLDELVSPLETRLAMLALALREHPAFEISLIEAERAGPSYTVDTLRELRRELPNAELFFIMGEDSLANFPTWHQPAEIVKLCKLAVLQRPKFNVNLDALEKKVPGVKFAVVFIRAPELDISSSDIRERVQRGESVRKFVPALVNEYITEFRLYLSQNSARMDQVANA